MQDEIITKQQLAERQHRSIKSISTACSRERDAVPEFFKLGKHKNSPIRFRLSDVIAWEGKQTAMEKQRFEEEKVRRSMRYGH